MSKIINLRENTKRFSRRELIFAFSAIIIIFGVGLGLGLYNSFNGRPDDSVSLEKAAKLDSIISKAETAANNGDFKSGAKYFDEAIEKEDDKKSKSSLLLGKATLYYNNDDKKEALNIALRADEISASSAVARFIAQLYEENGDTSNAIKYYKRSIELVDKNRNPVAEDDIKYYEYKINKLGG